ncbi:MAG: glucokinase [Microcoleaceae cyanobacterium]
MTVLLAGDIGGTKTILRLVESKPGEATTQTEEIRVIPELTTLYEQVYPSQEYDDLIPIVLRFLQAAQAAPDVTLSASGLVVEKACFGIAGPVVNNSCQLTNLSWSLKADTLQKKLNISKVSLINDFAAIGYGVLGLNKDEVHVLQAGEPNANSPMGVIGAGTGLGEGFVIPVSSGYQVFPTEGGHVDFSPRSEMEFQLFTYIKELYNIERVSVERVISGMGIATIYQFFRGRNPDLETAEMKAIFTQWKQEIGEDQKTIDLSAEVSRAAASGNDYLCEQTMKLFIEAYGMEAGNLALKLLPYGGLYIAGGIAAKNISLILSEDLFMNAFKAKGRIRPLMEKVPVKIVLNPKVGLIGAALCASQL